MTARQSPQLAPALAAGVTVACELATRSVARYGVEAVVTAAVAAALVDLSRRTVGLVAAAVGVAIAANLFVYPIGRAWLAASAVLFALSVVVTGLLARLAPAEASSGIATLRVP